MLQAVCLDTRILSMFLKGKPAVKQILDEYKANRFELYTTTVNIAEFFMGYYKTHLVVEEDVSRLREFFWTLHPRAIDYEAAHLSGQLYATTLKDQPIGWRDTFIAAIVLLNGKKIITSNNEHFQRIPELEVIEFH
jgi:predicted nucleic acid-binding protein